VGEIWRGEDSLRRGSMTYVVSAVVLLAQRACLFRWRCFRYSCRQQGNEGHTHTHAQGCNHAHRHPRSSEQVVLFKMPHSKHPPIHCRRSVEARKADAHVAALADLRDELTAAALVGGKFQVCVLAGVRSKGEGDRGFIWAVGAA
jgi:hypothetical protein